MHRNSLLFSRSSKYNFNISRAILPELFRSGGNPSCTLPVSTSLRRSYYALCGSLAGKSVSVLSRRQKIKKENRVFLINIYIRLLYNVYADRNRTIYNATDTMWSSSSRLRRFENKNNNNNTKNEYRIAVYFFIFQFQFDNANKIRSRLFVIE